jgi:hypothetical protein
MPALKDLSLVSPDNRRKLVKIAEEDHLHPSPWLTLRSSIETEEFFDTIKEISSDH